MPSNYIQSSGGVFYLRNKYGGVFAQDSWRARSNLTLNYGVRWDFMAPWYEKDNQIQTIVPGQQSVVYPGAPHGLVFPGDPGIPRDAVSGPMQQFRSATRHRLLAELDKRNTEKDLRSQREKQHPGEFRIVLHRVQGLSAGIMYGVPPYGYNYLSPAPPLFDKPFITAADGTNNGQRFPFPAPPLECLGEESAPRGRFRQLHSGQCCAVFLSRQQGAL